MTSRHTQDLIAALEHAAAGFAVLADHSDNDAAKLLALANFKACKAAVAKARGEGWTER